MRPAKARAAVIRPLVRLPVCLFPKQPVSLPIKGHDNAPASPLFRVSEELLSCARTKHDGWVAGMGPGSRIGVMMHLIDSDTVEGTGWIHAVGGQRVRLVRTRRSEGGGDAFVDPLLAEVSTLGDEKLLAVRRERLLDETAFARELLTRGQESGAFALDGSTLHEQLGGASQQRAHPHWEAACAPPEGAGSEDELSLWLGAQLPLSTDLRLRILTTLCPLKRMQDMVDALRLLCEPDRERGPGHKFRLTRLPEGELEDVDAPQRTIVSITPPSVTKWTSSDAFPHG
jgi:hypothetical protein